MNAVLLDTRSQIALEPISGVNLALPGNHNLLIISLESSSGSGSDSGSGSGNGSTSSSSSSGEHKNIWNQCRGQ